MLPDLHLPRPPLAGRRRLRRLVLMSTCLVVVACGAPRGDAGDSAASGAPASLPPGDTSAATATPAPASPALPERPPTPASTPPEPRPVDTPPPAAPTTPDSLRGTVAVIGSTPVTRVVIGTADGAEHLVVGPAVEGLRRVADLEVVVRGAREPRAFRATSFVVRAASGRPAQDGVLARDGDQWVLRRIDATPLLLGGLPDELRAHVGRRVWLVVADGGEVVSFGRVE